MLGSGVKKWYDAICDPADEPEPILVEGDSMKTLAPKKKRDDPDELIYPPSAFGGSRVMKPKAPYPKTRYTSSDFWWDLDESFGHGRLGADLLPFGSSPTASSPRTIPR